ncbi:TonB-dependent receptor [Pedobacter sp. FW305-3-2-15-E-R2A2]|uniref:SusC/RagA family TonB-linked outer membrane protein n=1 Tax=Pedobacter sp. FW305-3-2-15-E-R2A2 TaxID=3140251 RepID=UPI003140BCB4
MKPTQFFITKLLLICLLLLTAVTIRAQQNDGQLNGMVTDTKGKILPGVTVVASTNGIQKTSNTITNDKGKFQLSGLKTGASYDIIFSSVGFQKYTEHNFVIKPGETNSILVRLEGNNEQLNEIVVVGYGSQAKRDITGSVGSISGDQIENRSIGSLDQALTGKVAGLSVSNNSGTPGAGMMIRVRGVGTINNSEPLYVVDGNPFSNINNLDPQDIKSIEILKSASAAAIYGSRGANGVVLVTTKKGSNGAIKTDLNVFTGIQTLYKKLELTDAATYAKYYNQALVAGGQKPAFQDPSSYGKGTDWQHAIFRNAPINKYGMALSGGKDGDVYRLSGSYLKQKGMLIGTDYSKLGFSLNSAHQMKKWLKFGENFNYAYTTQNNVSDYNSDSRGIIATALQMSPTVPVKNPDGSYGVSPFANTYNPVAAVENIQHLEKDWQLAGSVYGQADLFKGLNFKSQFNITVGNGRSRSYTPVYFVSNSQKEDVSSLEETASNHTQWAWENTLNYNRTFGDHRIEGLLGFTGQHSFESFIRAYGQNLPADASITPSLQYLDLASSGMSVGGGGDEWGMVSYYGRLNYDYKNTYLATVNLRRDGSSKFGANNRFGTFPSFSLGWRLSNEPFLKNISFLNDLKLRGGWGALGNAGSLSTSATVSTLKVNIPYPFGAGNGQVIHLGATPSSIGNPDLKWESTEETDFGIDASLFENRITFAADYYHRVTTGILIQLPILASVGVREAPFVNGGNVLNKGFEFTMGYRSDKSRDFSYELSANFALNHNEVTSLTNDGAAFYAGEISSGVDVSKTAVGHPIGSFYGYVTDGIFQNQQQINQAAKQPGAAPGDIRFKDLNGDGIVDDKDQTYIGSPWAKYTYGFSANFFYKNIDLAIGINGRGGNQIYTAWKHSSNASGISNYYAPDKLKSWTGEGSTNTEPRVNILDPNNNMRPSNRWIQSGAFLRINSLQLGYSLPKSPLEKLGISRIRFYLGAENLLTFTKYDGYDPEVGMRDGNDGDPLDVGIDRAYYPRPRTFSAGLNVSF